MALSRSVAVVGLCAGLATGAVAIPALADSTSTPSSTPSPGTTSSTPDHHRLILACRRVPKAINRTQRVINHLQGDVDTRGSVARLQHRIDLARQQHDDLAVALLQNRMEVRSTLVRVLPQRLSLLRQVQVRCAAHAATSGSNSADTSGDGGNGSGDISGNDT